MAISDTILIGLAAATQLSFSFVIGELVPMKYRFVANAYIYLLSIPGGNLFQHRLRRQVWLSQPV
jgi:hypothetical protein